MANTAVTGGNVVKLTKNTAVAAPSGQTVASGDTAVITPPTGVEFSGRYLLVVLTDASGGTTTTATLKAGSGSNRQDYLYGDGTPITFTANQKKLLQLDLGRFGTDAGTISIAVGGSGGSLTVAAYILDKSAA